MRNQLVWYSLKANQAMIKMVLLCYDHPIANTSHSFAGRGGSGCFRNRASPMCRWPAQRYPPLPCSADSPLWWASATVRCGHLPRRRSHGSCRPPCHRWLTGSWKASKLSSCRICCRQVPAWPMQTGIPARELVFLDVTAESMGLRLLCFAARVHNLSGISVCGN